MQQCIQQLRIRIVLQFLDKEFFGKWKVVDEIIYTLGDGNPSGDMTYFQLFPRSS
ncbi:MAG: hypothetical protein ACC656_10600 [Candidatus Heimdallarchaeota archaeon]